MLKMNIFEYLIQTRPELRSSVFFLFCITCILSESQKSTLQSKAAKIKQIAGEDNNDVIELVMKKNLKKYKRIVYLELSDVYFEVAYQERVSFYSLEYKLLRKELGKLMVDEQTSSVDALNYNVKKENPMRLEKYFAEFSSLIKSIENEKRHASGSI